MIPRKSYWTQISWSNFRRNLVIAISYIDGLQRKLKQRLGLLKIIEYSLHLKTRKLYVNTMVFPVLEHTCTIWGDKNNQILMNSLEITMIKSTKLIIDRYLLSSSSEALQILVWNTLTKREVISPMYIRLLFFTPTIIDGDCNLIFWQTDALIMQ